MLWTLSVSPQKYVDLIAVTDKVDSKQSKQIKAWFRGKLRGDW
jgi:hypothetical protein